MKIFCTFVQNYKKMKQNFKIVRDDYILANKKAAREEELATHGHPVGYWKVHKSKKIYDRKRSKANQNKGLPFFWSSFFGVSRNVCVSLCVA